MIQRKKCEYKSLIIKYLNIKINKETPLEQKHLGDDAPLPYG